MLTRFIDEMGLPPGIAKSLAVKLDVARHSLGARDGAACGVLRSFIEEAAAQSYVTPLLWQWSLLITRSAVDVRAMLQCR